MSLDLTSFLVHFCHFHWIGQRLNTNYQTQNPFLLFFRAISTNTNEIFGICLNILNMYNPSIRDRVQWKKNLVLNNTVFSTFSNFFTRNKEKKL